MPKTNGSPTNKDLNSLLANLGFQQGEKTQKLRRVWRHSEAGTIILLPSNRTLEPASQVDLVSVRTHLDRDGHMEASEFDEFVVAKKHSVVS